MGKPGESRIQAFSMERQRRVVRQLTTSIALPLPLVAPPVPSPLHPLPSAHPHWPLCWPLSVPASPSGLGKGSGQVQKGAKRGPPLCAWLTEQFSFFTILCNWWLSHTCCFSWSPAAQADACCAALVSSSNNSFCACNKNHTYLPHFYSCAR